MNNKNRIFSKGIQHFQQGGNIAIGSPKPYTTQLPGININPLTLTNAPIEINTTGITDQINKMRDLAYKREELAFKYKELEYKEGKDYLDLLGDIYKGIGSANSSAASSGGFGSLGVYGQKQAEINAKRNEIMGKLSTARGSVKDISRVANELMAFETSEEVLSHKTKAGFINDAVKSIQKGDLGVYGPQVFNDLLDHVMKGDGTIPFEDLAKNYTTGLGGSVAAKDLDTYTKSFDYLFEPQEVITSEVLNNGLTSKKTSYVQLSTDDALNAFLSATSLDPNGKAYMHQLKASAAEVGVSVQDYLRPIFDAKRKSKQRSVSEEYSGSVKTDVKKNADGTFSSTKDDGSEAGGKSEAEWRAKLRIATEATASKYGEGFATLAEVQDAILESKDSAERDAKIAKLAKDRGLAVADDEGIKKKVPFGDANNADILRIAAMNKSNQTKYFEKDGEWFLVTDDNEIKTKVKGLTAEKKELDPSKLKKEYGFEVRPPEDFVNPMYGLVNRGIVQATMNDDIFNVYKVSGPSQSNNVETAKFLSDKDKDDYKNLTASVLVIGNEIFGETKVKPTSAYRTEEENSAAKGSDTSYHKKGDALDYSWDESLYKRMTSGDLKPVLDKMGYEASKHDPAKIGYGTGVHIHIQPKSRISSIKDRPTNTTGVMPSAIKSVSILDL